MRDFLRARVAQGMPTVPLPFDATAFPPRFRGRPVAVADLAGGDAADGQVIDAPSAGAQHGRLLPVFDRGACLFSPEETTAHVAFTCDHRMASSARAGLVPPESEFELIRPLQASMRRLFGRSLRLRSVAAGSCGGCESEMTALSNVVFDMARFGIQFVASPRHADGIVVTGAVSQTMREALRMTYDAVASPKIVIAVGACAATGGPFRASDQVNGGVPDDLPVDLWIPGCPPHPLTILDGLLRLLGRIEHAANDTALAARSETGVTEAPSP